jgi:hypothetical protein
LYKNIYCIQGNIALIYQIGEKAQENSIEENREQKNHSRVHSPESGGKEMIFDS